MQCKCLSSSLAGTIPHRPQNGIKRRKIISLAENAPEPSERRSPPPSPYSSELKIERVEGLGKESWAGVAAVDRGETDQSNSWGRIAVLLVGDATALLLFAAIGRSSHNEGLSFGDVFGTAWPFILGWYISAGVLGGYRKIAQGGDVGPAAMLAAKCWALGIPLGLLFRSVSRGYLPDKAFIAVALVATGVLLVGWRTGLAKTRPEKTSQAKDRKNKKGNPFEFLQLLFGLVSRW